MQNRKNDLSLGTFLAVGKTHSQLHDAKDIIEIVEAIQGPTMETLMSGAVVDALLEGVHGQMKSYSEDQLKEVAAQFNRVNADIAAKKADIGDKIAAKNNEREKYAVKAGLFASAKSASNSDTEEVSSLAASPVTPRM